MSSLLSIGARALLANQVGLSTTGHNIANASTVGYSRQTAVAQQVPGQYTGSGYIGKGVEITTIQRAHSDFLTRQAALAQSVQAKDVARADKLSALADIFQGGTSGLGAAVNDLLNAWSDVASNPTDVTARNVVLTRADEMAARFRNAQAQLNDLQAGADAQLGDAVKSINALATRLAQLNEQIVRAQGSGQPPNDLLDQRDQALRELGQFVQTSTVQADDGSLNVFIGSQALVMGNSAAAVSLTGDSGGPLDLTLTRGAFPVSVDGASLGGGSVAGLLQFRNQDLAEARDGLGRMAMALATEINNQHRLGVDLDGAAGANLFTAPVIPDALGAVGNAGNATVGAQVADASQLVASSYQLRFGAGGSVQVTRLSDGKVTSFAGPMPVQVDGLTLNVSNGTAADGDSFLLRPYADAAGAMGVAISSPRELAAASPVQASAGSGNTGSVAVAGLAASSANPNLTATVTLTFTGAGTFDVSGTGTGNPTGVAYVAGQSISYNGWTLTLNGTPKAGDTITVELANPAYSPLNAGNASALLALRDKAVFDGAPLSDGYAGLMAQVGVRAQSAQYAASVSSSIASSLETQRTGVSGVNLDEEAAKLLQYQQAYQASAKMIQVAQNLFDALIQNLG